MESHNNYFGMRFIRLYFAFNAGCTWGELFDRVETQQAWKKIESADKTSGSEQVWWMAHMPRVDQWQQSQSFRERPAVFMTEVELLIAPYLEMRLRTHIWKQIFTANSPKDLCQVFLADSCATVSCANAKTEDHDDTETEKNK